MTAGEWIGLVAAGAFLLLVLVLCVPLLKLGRTVDQATRALTEVADGLGPALTNLNVTIEEVNETLSGVNTQLAKVDTMTTHVQQITTNAAALTSLVTATVGSPLVKVAAFTYGVRRAMVAKRRADVQHEVSDRIKADRRGRRRRRSR